MTYIHERQSFPKAPSSWFSLTVQRNIGQYGREPSSDNSVAYLPRFFLTLTNNRTVSQTVFKTVHDYGTEYCKMTFMFLILTTDKQFSGEIYQEQSFMKKLHAHVAFLKVRAATIMAKSSKLFSRASTTCYTGTSKDEITAQSPGKY